MARPGHDHQTTTARSRALSPVPWAPSACEMQAVLSCTRWHRAHTHMSQKRLQDRPSLWLRGRWKECILYVRIVNGCPVRNTPSTSQRWPCRVCAGCSPMACLQFLVSFSKQRGEIEQARVSCSRPAATSSGWAWRWRIVSQRQLRGGFLSRFWPSLRTELLLCCVRVLRVVRQRVRASASGGRVG